MHKFQKILTFALAGAILTTTMSGCGGKKKNNPAATKTETIIETDSASKFSTWSDNAKVRAAIENKDFATAQFLSSARIEENPGDSRAHFFLGQALLEQGELIKARKSFEAAVKLAPEDLNYARELNKCLSAMADSAIELDLPSEAIELLKKLLNDNYLPGQTEQKLATVYTSTSEKLINAGNTEEAESILREAINIIPDHADLKVKLAMLLINSDRLMEAERILKALKETNPDCEQGLVAYAMLLHRTGEMSKANSTLEEALQISPANPEALALKASFSQDIPALTVTQTPESDMGLDAILDKLKQLEKTGSFSGQKRLLETIVENFPKEDWALLNLSIVSEKLGQIDNAIQSIEKYLALKPESAKGQMQYARCLYQKGQNDKALAILDQLESTYPDKLELLSERGQIMARMGNFAQARELWSLVLKTSPEHISTLFNLGQLEMESGNNEEAKAYFEKIISKEPFNNKYRYFAGINLIQSGMKDQAHALWETAKASMNTEDPYAAKILMALGEGKPTPATNLPVPVIASESESIAEPVIVQDHEINETSGNSDYEKGLEYARGGFFNEAIQSFRAVLLQDPSNFNALMNLGKVYTATGKQNFASVFYLKALKLDPQNVFALKSLANSYADVGMHSLAVQINEQVKITHPDQLEGFPKYAKATLKNDPRAIEPMIQALLAEKLNAEAMAVIQNALGQQSELTVLHLLQGDIFKQMGQFEQAMEAYKTAIIREAQNPEPYIRIGDLYLASGQADNAIEEYQKALKSGFIDPDSMFVIVDRFRQTNHEADAKSVLGRLKGMNLNQEQLKKLDQRLGINTPAPIKEE